MTANALKTHCRHGHEFTPENTRLRKQAGASGPKRDCRTCERERALPGTVSRRKARLRRESAEAVEPARRRSRVRGLDAGGGGTLPWAFVPTLEREHAQLVEQYDHDAAAENGRFDGAGVGPMDATTPSRSAIPTLAADSNARDPGRAA